jgi:glycosyltransferase involved in cell wall biosynthesis
MKKVLWLASWYPHEGEPFSGDFIQRQAEAVSLYQPLQLIYIGKLTTVVEKQIPPPSGRRPGNLQELIIYYSTGKNFLSKWNSLKIYFRKHREIFKDLRKNNEMPDLVHAHVAMKAGLVALYIRWKYKIPYLLTEHWSGYYEQSRDSLFNKSFVERYLTRRIIKNASLLLPVSRALGEQINRFWIKKSFKQIPNVVNTHFFYPADIKNPQPFRFIHISSLLYPKNPEGIINCFVNLLQSGMDAELVLVGPLNISIRRLLNENKLLTGKLISTGELPYEEVGKELRKANAMILFSFYENMPCVILEALCTGVPVIASRVGGIPEIILDGNGILVEPGNENELQEAMKKMILHYDSYDREEISRIASSRYSYETIGKEIVGVYDDLLNKK